MKKRRAKLKKGVWLALLGLLALSLLMWEMFGGGFFRENSYFTETARLDIASGAYSFFAVDDGIFVLEDAGLISFFQEGRVEVFRRAHGIQNATLFANGSFAAVLAQGGRALDMHNTSGLVYAAVTDGAVLRFALGACGHAVAVIEAGSGHNVILIDPLGQMSILAYFEGKSPTAVAVYDGWLAIAHADVSGAILNATVTIISFDGTLQAVSLHNPYQIIGKLLFMDDNVLAVSNSRVFSISRMSGNTLWEKELGNRLLSFSAHDDYFAMLYGANLLNAEGYLLGMLHVYNSAGEQVFASEYALAERISLAYGQIVIQTADQVFIYSVSTGELMQELQMAGQLQFMSENRFAVSSRTSIGIFERR